jgi:SAM-dependent methyltransferase
MTDDVQRVLDDYGPMSDAYADESDTDPVKVSYDRPAILAMSGDVRGKRILDVGCATGALAGLLVERGATVEGIDLNPTFIDRARARLGERATFRVADISTPMPFLDDSSFDVVVASLVLHYLRDWSTPLREFARVLRPRAALILSTHHPTHDLHDSEPSGDYFETVLLTDTWRKGGRLFNVRFYHRPLSAIVDALAEAGFVIERIPEPLPDEAAFAASPAFYTRMRRVPWFLFLRAIKRP